MFLDFFILQENSVYNLKKRLLNKKLATNPLSGPNGLIYTTNERAELVSDSFMNQLKPNPGSKNIKESTYEPSDSRELAILTF